MPSQKNSYLMYKFQPDYIQHTHTHTHFLSFCNQISYLINHFVLSITDKSNENDDHIVALSELLEDFCKQNERIFKIFRTAGFTQHGCAN